MESVIIVMYSKTRHLVFNLLPGLLLLKPWEFHKSNNNVFHYAKKVTFEKPNEGCQGIQPPYY